MMMIVDDDVARPETCGLAAGWAASMLGMMTLVRVLHEDKYDNIMAMIKEGKKDTVMNRFHRLLFPEEDPK
jgi:hypothetical protein